MFSAQQETGAAPFTPLPFVKGAGLDPTFTLLIHRLFLLLGSAFRTM
jgi:hypothetical protein